MAWSQENPGAGEPSGILDEASRRTRKAEALRSMQVTLTAAQAEAGGAEWTAQSRDAFVSYLASITPDVDRLIAGLDEQAAALGRYSVEVDAIKAAQRALEAQRDEAKSRLGWHRQAMSLFPPDAAGSGEDSVTRARVEASVADEHSILNATDVHWHELVARRQAADAACVLALESGAVLGDNSAFAGGKITSTAAAGLLGMMATLSESDLAVLLATHPELIKKAVKTDEHAAKAWWESLAEPGATERSPAQLALVAGAPAVIGALGGIPPLARVAANRYNAATRLAAGTEELRRDTKAGGSLSKDARAGLVSEQKYLKSVVDGKIQLVLYDRENSRIAEMIGTPSVDTKEHITYSPGTFANMDKFYSGDAQELSNWYVDRHPDTVAIVYKDGLFPGDTDGDRSRFDWGLMDANKPELAEAAGKRLAKFEEGLSPDPYLSAASKTGIGHSWGLTNVTSAEVYGTHYDDVVSLSGAWEPKGWKPDPTTNYSDYSYLDALQLGQATGGVGEGKNPRSTEAFEFGDYYDGPVDPMIQTPDGPVPNFEVLVENHNLVASAEADNAEVLFDLERRLYK